MNRLYDKKGDVQGGAKNAGTKRRVEQSGNKVGKNSGENESQSKKPRANASKPSAESNSAENPAANSEIADFASEVTNGESSKVVDGKPVESDNEVESVTQNNFDVSAGENDDFGINLNDFINKANVTLDKDDKLIVEDHSVELQDKEGQGLNVNFEELEDVQQENFLNLLKKQFNKSKEIEGSAADFTQDDLKLNDARSGGSDLSLESDEKIVQEEVRKNNVQDSLDKTPNIEKDGKEIRNTVTTVGDIYPERVDESKLTPEQLEELKRRKEIENNNNRNDNDLYDKQRANAKQDAINNFISDMNKNNETESCEQIEYLRNNINEILSEAGDCSVQINDAMRRIMELENEKELDTKDKDSQKEELMQKIEEKSEKLKELLESSESYLRELHELVHQELEGEPKEEPKEELEQDLRELNDRITNYQKTLNKVEELNQSQRKEGEDKSVISPLRDVESGKTQGNAPDSASIPRNNTRSFEQDVGSKRGEGPGR